MTAEWLVVVVAAAYHLALVLYVRAVWRANEAVVRRYEALREDQRKERVRALRP